MLMVKMQPMDRKGGQPMDESHEYQNYNINILNWVLMPIFKWLLMVENGDATYGMGREGSLWMRAMNMETRQLAPSTTKLSSAQFDNLNFLKY